MISGWDLPDHAEIGGKKYRIFCDFRDVLDIFSYFADPDLPDYLRWHIALQLFYDGEIPEKHMQDAIAYLQCFLNGGKQEPEKAGKPLMDWEQDADLIVADINKVAGAEIRAMPFVHWWTFLSWFHAIGEGQLSTVVAIRSKLQKGKKLDTWEQDFYRENQQRVTLKKRHSQQELREREKLERLLTTE